MAQLYDMQGQLCGYIGDDQAVPEGYWTRADDAQPSMAPVDFLDRIGPTRFGAIWSAAVSNPSIAFPMMRGFAAQSILIAESFPALIQMEQMGLLPAGTALEVWA